MATITEDHVRAYHQHGFCVIDDAISAHELATLRSECDRFIGRVHDEMDRLGTDTIGISHRGRRYFIPFPSEQSEELRRLFLGYPIAAFSEALLGPDVFAFYEQFVVKSAEVGMSFAWHQDSGYVDYHGGAPHRPYLTCWIPLDDATAENGTVHLLPFERAGTRDVIPHFEQEGSNDKVGYTGDDPGEVIEVAAGSMLAFSSVALHRSGPNLTDQPRRVYLAQYSAEPIRHRDGSLWARAAPILVDGERHAAR